MVQRIGLEPIWDYIRAKFVGTSKYVVLIHHAISGEAQWSSNEVSGREDWPSMSGNCHLVCVWFMRELSLKVHGSLSP